MVIAKMKSGEAAKLAALGLLTALAAGALVWQGLWPRPLYGWGVTVDRLSAVLALLVGTVGIVTFRFSMRYLDGATGKDRFLNLLCYTVCAAYLLMLATNLLLLFAAWSLVSAGLHKLLLFYPNRPEAIAPARKKFLISRLGDVALVGAIALIWFGWDTTDLHVFLSRLAAGDGRADLVAVLVAVAALTKSAQFPFHSWLPETMESPTPVSALMHAGVINAGGALVLRFAPLIGASPTALTLLVVVGTLTAALGMLAMWAQVKVKRTLAWSTVSQMGFMMIQCGLAVFPAAALHIVGHGCYKAWSFLRTGSLPDRALPAAPVPPTRTLFLAAVGTLLAIPAMYLGSVVTGFDPTHSPGELALAGIVALSIGQAWVALLGQPGADNAGTIGRLASAIGLTTVAAVGAFALYHGAAMFLAPVLGSPVPPTGWFVWVLAGLPVLTITGLVVLHALLPVLAGTVAGRALYVHALHGFYFGAMADRLVEWLWRNPVRKEVQRA